MLFPCAFNHPVNPFPAFKVKRLTLIAYGPIDE